MYKPVSNLCLFENVPHRSLVFIASFFFLHHEKEVIVLTSLPEVTVEVESEGSDRSWLVSPARELAGGGGCSTLGVRVVFCDVFWIHVMGLSSVDDDDIEMKEGMVVQLKEDTEENRNNLMIEDVGMMVFDLEPEFDFSPIQHPTEPSHEDRPVQCPMPHSSHFISDERMQDHRSSHRKKPEAKIVLDKENNALKAIESPIRMVRKRHHDHTNTITPLLQTPHVHPHMHQKDG
ncbi:hypothetical protein QVD17_33077 [Tagetes erecta]|uniref:Uncharacterized protein n=1 Tax=Tagetes erecta TaxID=13708 RepID=A0AAD8JYE4_TARER|nr:hypothetical protein QVD17_33077 [Tagetes erecta]